MERELAQVSSTIREAGKRATDLARKGFEVQIKKDRSPVTTADFEVNRVLHEMQQTYFPDDGWLSEESPTIPLGWKRGVCGSSIRSTARKRTSTNCRSIASPSDCSKPGCLCWAPFLIRPPTSCLRPYSAKAFA